MNPKYVIEPNPHGGRFVYQKNPKVLVAVITAMNVVLYYKDSNQPQALGHYTNDQELLNALQQKLQ